MPVTEENDEGLLAAISTKRQETKISITDLLGNPIEGATIGLYAVDEEGKAGEGGIGSFYLREIRVHGRSLDGRYVSAPHPDFLCEEEKNLPRGDLCRRREDYQSVWRRRRNHHAKCPFGRDEIWAVRVIRD